MAATVTPYEKQLHGAIKQAAGRGAKRPPEGVLRYIAALNDPLAAAFDNQAGHALFSKLREDFEHLVQARDFSRPLTNQEHTELVELIRWLLVELKNIKSLEESGGKLLACFAISRFIGTGRTLWQNISLSRKQSANLFAALGKLLVSCQCSFSSRGLPAPTYEQEMVDHFQDADQKADFVELESSLKSLMDVMLPHFLLEEATLCLAYHDFSTLVGASSRISQTASALWIVAPLPNTLRLRLAVACNSNRVRFAALYQTFHDRRRKQRSFGKTNHKLLAALLVNIAKDRTIWHQFMSIFNKYPVRYPALQTALGEALARGSVSSCVEYVEAIDVGGASGLEEVSGCLSCFRRCASSELQRVLFERCYQRWNALMDLKSGDNNNRFDLLQTEIDYGVVAFMTEFMEYDEIDAKIKSLEAEFSILHLQWYVSETELTSAYYTILSRLQLYTHAKRIMEFGGDYSLTKGYLPPSVLANRYFLRIDRNLSQ